MTDKVVPTLGIGPLPTAAAGVDVRGLIVTFGAVNAVDGLNLLVPQGAGVALVGRNGAGKSTSLRVLGGVLPASSGVVRVAGVDAVADPQAARARVGYCPDVGGLIPRATPWEHLQLAAHMRELSVGWQQRAEHLLDRFDLAGSAHRVTAGFSHGMGRRLSVLLAAFHRPDVLLLDEPFDGVDPLGVDATLAEVREARDRGAAVVISTHLLELALEVCDEAVVLRRGQVVSACPAEDLRGDVGRNRYRELLG